jgi:hypothetical protein
MCQLIGEKQPPTATIAWTMPPAQAQIRCEWAASTVETDGFILAQRCYLPGLTFAPPNLFHDLPLLPASSHCFLVKTSKHLGIRSKIYLPPSWN